MRCVVTTVHGTFARNAAWIQPDSNLGKALREHFGEGVVVVPFRWSGHNNPSARDKAQHELRGLLHCLARQYPSARHYVVAHSHGGNVAFYALRDAALRERIAGVACLATPFLVARPRVLGSQDVTKHVAGALGFLILVVGLLPRWWLPAFEPAWLRELMLLAFLFFSMMLLAALLRSWYTLGRLLHENLQLPTLPREKVLILHAPGDEAWAGLLFFQFVSQVSVRIYLWMYQLHERLIGRLTCWRERRLRLLAAAVGGFVLYMTAIIAAAAIEIPMAGFIALMFVLFWPLVAVPALTAIGWIKMAAGPLEIVVGGLLLAIIILLSIALLPFYGWQFAVSNLLHDVTVETIPPGTWEATQVVPRLDQLEAGQLQPLQHSAVYDNPDSLTLICDWMERTGMTSSTAG